MAPGRAMRIAVASGKGGTGKTTVATSLAFELASRGVRAAYFDCDVEAPNGHIFLRPEITDRTEVSVPVPLIDADRCKVCGACAEACRYNALACLKDRVLVFPELCHGCGACSLVCPECAVSEVGRSVGTVESGTAGALAFAQGKLAVGEASATPVVRALKRRLPGGGFVILDAPPGASCPVVETLRGVDAVLMVADPTPFGVNDLKIAVDVARQLKVPLGIVVNRSDVGDSGLREYCRRENLLVKLEIPNSRRVAEAYARGVLPGLIDSEFASLVSVLTDAVERMSARSRAE